MRTAVINRLSILVASAAIIACKGSDAPKVPLDQAQMPAPGASQQAPTAITGDARIALDSANVLFRAKAYDKALEQYEKSASLAPAELAPLLGIMMVADITNDRKLAEATLPRIRKIDPSAADSSLLMPHSKMMLTHPKVNGDKSL